MKAFTVELLDRLNRDFYREYASEFSATRKHPWPGWERVFEIVERQLGHELTLECQRRPDGARLSFLDLGCGNGRILPELERRFGDRISYLGLDASIPLLAHAARTARSSLCIRARLLAADLVGRRLAEIVPEAGFDLVLAFGLLHHLPSFERRRELLASAASRLRRGGLMALSFWQFADAERFRRRFVAWDDAPSRLTGLDASDLEDGDHLLAWGDGGAVRYCHHATTSEADRLVESLPLATVARFSADGRSGQLNLYRLLRKV